MDEHLDEQDQPTRDRSVATRRFAKLTQDADAVYPMISPPAATVDEDIDEQILAGLVDV